MSEPSAKRAKTAPATRASVGVAMARGRNEAAELTRARLALARATQIVIASGLAIFGVEPVEEMR